MHIYVCVCVCVCMLFHLCNDKCSTKGIEAGEKHASGKMVSSTAKENHRAQRDCVTGGHTAFSMGSTSAAKAHTAQQASCSGSALSRTSGPKGTPWRPGQLLHFVLTVIHKTHALLALLTL